MELSARFTICILIVIQESSSVEKYLTLSCASPWFQEIIINSPPKKKKIAAYSKNGRNLYVANILLYIKEVFIVVIFISQRLWW